MEVVMSAKFALKIQEDSPEFRISRKTNNAGDGVTYGVVSVKTGINLRKLRVPGALFTEINSVVIGGAIVEFSDKAVTKRAGAGVRNLDPTIKTVKTGETVRAVNFRIDGPDGEALKVTITAAERTIERTELVVWSTTVTPVTTPDTVADWATV